MSINDDHSVAVGTSGGSVIVYDVRWKGPILTLPPLSQTPVKSVAFQPPNWAMDMASKEKAFVPVTRQTRMSPNLESGDTLLMQDTAKNTTAYEHNLMDVFSPVNVKRKSFF